MNCGARKFIFGVNFIAVPSVPFSGIHHLPSPGVLLQDPHEVDFEVSVFDFKILFTPEEPLKSNSIVDI